MNKKRAMSLLLGASLCLPLSACGGESGPVKTTVPPAGPPVCTQPERVPPVMTEPSGETTQPEPQDGDMVRVADYIPDILVELKYATADNFTKQVIYDFQDAYLRYGTVKKLRDVQASFREVGLRLKIWDGFRPVSAQFKLWEVCPDDTYVADPRRGYSNHNRGCAVDVTLVDQNGQELEMPTAFDDFSAMADRDYSDCPAAAAENAMLLQTIMEKYGFRGYFGEWWHFNDTVRYEVGEEFDPVT